MKKLTLVGIFLIVLILFPVSVHVAYGQEEPKVEWVARYDSAAEAIAVDPSGNVYVTGSSYTIGTGGDYATVKYDRNGNEVWVARYTGPGIYDSASAIAVDPSGNVYVTGVSGIWTSGVDYATVKYDRDGNEVWVERYNGPGNTDDGAQALAVDPSGNVYVTGGSEGIGTGYDYATVKYDRDGNEVWVERYSGPEDLDDEASAIAVDPQGNVYVSGDSYRLGTSWDYATIKYDRNGNEAWVARYDRYANIDYYGNALAVDPKGNVYVTGVSAGIGVIDYATVKYDRNGNEAWVARYNGPGNSYDYAAAIAVDPSGNVYVTGVSYGSGTGGGSATIKYSK